MWLLEIESRLGWECLPAVSSFDTLTPFTEGSGYLNSGPHSCTAFSKEPSAAQLPFFFETGSADCLRALGTGPSHFLDCPVFIFGYFKPSDSVLP